MTFLEKIYKLMQPMNIKKSQLCTELGISQNSFVNWENRGTLPSGEILIKLAQYFNVSADYLLGLDEVPNRKNLFDKNLKKEETKMLESFRKLNYEDQLIEIGRVEGIYEKYSPEQKENVEAKNAETA